MGFTVISTFSGCGGSSLGYKLAGGDVRLAAEWDDNAVETYRLNFPATPIFHGDVAALTPDEAMRLAGLQPGELDVFDGSPPCQGFSMAGRRHLDDPRNQLFKEYVRLLRGLQPRVFVMENVAGMVKGAMRAVFDECMVELRGSGYRVSCRLMRTDYFGVPQARPRLIFIGARADLGVDPTHPAPQTRPTPAASALLGLAIDEAERAWLLEQGKLRTSFKYWHQIAPGRALSHLTNGSGFSCRKVNPNRPCPTVPKNDGCIGLHGLMHWAEPRRFTVGEYKRLFSFPDDFKFSGEWSDAVARMGNCVPPMFMRAIAAHVSDTVLRVANGLAA